MKLGATLGSERGKGVSKTGNEYIDIAILDAKQNTIASLRLKHGYHDVHKRDMYELCYQTFSDTICVAQIKEIGNLKHGTYKLNEIYPDIFPNK